MPCSAYSVRYGEVALPTPYRAHSHQLFRACGHQSQDSDVPRLFQFVPVPTRKWYKKLAPSRMLSQPYRIHLLCEHGDDAMWHFTDHPGMDVSQPRKFLLKAAPYLKLLLRFMAGAARAGCSFGFPLPNAAGAASTAVAETVLMARIGEVLRSFIIASAINLDEYWCVHPPV